MGGACGRPGGTFAGQLCLFTCVFVSCCGLCELVWVRVWSKEDRDIDS